VRSADEAQHAAASVEAVVLDSRAHARYTGEEALPSETRVGHVPGALSAPWAANLQKDGTFRSPEELRERFSQLGVGDSGEVIFYCGSGVTACHNLLALERAGMGPGALFVGSWSAWSADDARPVAGGVEPFGEADGGDGVVVGT
jgi:thiosulfate/3-mercaptopyruvate sulfurtransferase